MNNNNLFIDIKNYDELLQYIKKGYVITLEVGSFKVNFKRIIKQLKPCLQIYNFGVYNLEKALFILGSRYNAIYKIYRTPDYEIQYSDLDVWLMEFWLGRGEL